MLIYQWNTIYGYEAQKECTGYARDLHSRSLQLLHLGQEEAVGESFDAADVCV